MIGKSEPLTIKAYAIELLIVIFGITVAFQIEKLDNNHREAAAHQTLRQGLMSEIELNLEELAQVQDRSRKSFEHSAHAFELLTAEDRGATPELESALAWFAQVSLPEIQSSQLDAYLESDLTATSSARPELIELRGRLAELEDVGRYRTDYLLDRFLPLLSPVYDFTKGEIMDVDGVWDFRMRNAVGLLVSLEQSHLETQHAAYCALINARVALETADEGRSDGGESFDYGECKEAD